MPLTAVPARRHPLQVFVAAWVALAGLQMLLGGPRPGSVTATLPGPVLLAWSVVLVVGSGALLAAAVVRAAVTALYLELVGYLPLALALAAYPAAVLAAVGPRAAVLPVLVITGLAAAFGVLAGYTWRDLVRLRKVLHDA